ncbi:protein jagged-2-like [Chanos chanos]|uniref:Delta-like protein n=1 Tax=Chanos chanos TaxID=29144 RepID=A0A6J2V9M4_CHACN|nr:protein jagged-2-like [Chanos chanos]
MWSYLGSCFLTACLLLTLCVKVSQSSGYFLLQLVSVENESGELASGECCDGTRSPQDSRCSQDECDTYLKVCLKEYQVEVTTSGSCTYGTASSNVLGGNSFQLKGANDTPNKINDVGTILIPFHFAWPRAYTLIVEAWDFDNDTLDDSSEELLIERSIHRGEMNPGEEGQLLRHNGQTAILWYSMHVRCDRHYYGSKCNKQCRPRDDYFGHYTCDHLGNPKCIEGWTGEGCKKAICKQGCSEQHGGCVVPGECVCNYGWQGPFCDQCLTYPGCLHGTCSRPWQCTCEKNWGGLLCDKDLNYCGTHQPCVNGGTCLNTEPDEYYCNCPEGYWGKNCEMVRHACVSNPCANGGSCHEVSSGFTCQCTAGWEGQTCAIDTDECVSNPCAHGGTCIDTENGFDCICPSQWTGRACQIDVDECIRRPCLNAHSCKNLIGGFHCACYSGWVGQKCDININSCYGQCQNGGTCQAGRGGYTCLCRPGFVGTRCELQWSGCISAPCQNGGQCYTLLDSYTCQCPQGFTGTNCEVWTDPCSPNPCQNNGQCLVVSGDFHCACPDQYEGKTCSQPRDHCKSSHCRVIDSCTTAVVSNSTHEGVWHILSNVCGPNGRCISQSGGNFSCDCQPGFTGTYCHENINDCVSSPCMNGGTCVDGVNSFYCLCPDGWDGPLCEHNVNECDGNPCKNGGRCQDLLNDFYCHCTDNWKGKTCHSRESQCDSHTCANGGTCQDHGDTFSCVCPAGWGGSTCNTAKNSSCDTGPCANGGTCVGGVSGFTCICKDGWEGPTCDQNVNDCNPHPCFNGGVCVDGVNWFHCECASGFTGPDCRINIDECQSSPCVYGATCVDEINSFRCLCPVGWDGPRCQDFLGTAMECSHSGSRLPLGWHWEEDCNICQCFHGNRKCSKVYCGRRLCLLQGGPGIPEHSSCPGDQECVTHHHLSCFRPPCHWGVCYGPEYLEQVSTICQPSGGQQDKDCAHVTLVFDKDSVPQGTTVEGICSELRYLPITRTLAKDHTLLILCDLSHSSSNAVEVAMSFDGNGAGVNPGEIQEVVSSIISALSSPHNSTVLLAVREVKVEPQVTRSAPGYLLLVLCVVFSVLWLLCAIVCVWWVRKRRKATERAGVALPEDNINNQWEMQHTVRVQSKTNTARDHATEDPRQEQKALMSVLDRVGDGAEEVENEEDRERELVVDKCPTAKSSKGQVVYSIHRVSQEPPHRTDYSNKRYCCKNKMMEGTKDHYV